MLISILRTIVPALWGSVIGWALTLLPVLEPLRADLLAYGDFAVPVIAAVIIGGWYALWRWLEPKLPDWLTRILLGSAQAPVYVESNGRHEATEADWAEAALMAKAPYDTDATDAAYPISDEHEPTQSPARE